ncbi:hypothetical protein ACFY4B_27055 [Kitasatospora sp. NPDC001261]|uniref:hypothetical protein n=1 Tax=Kitasatospora sp. NPDC001261 TaxID=3364012 RepID=UPI0036AC1D8F
MATDPRQRDTVSGRRYGRTRVRGFAPWRPRASTRQLVEQIQEVLDEYQHLGSALTARQVYYRLVGRSAFEKTESNYDRLIETLNRARRARLIPMWAIRDDTANQWLTGGYRSPGEFWDSVRSQASGYRHDLSDGQPYAIELWIEAGGMVPLLGQLAQDYGVDAYGSGGYESVTAKYEAARRIADRDRPTHILHVGDHDPSGLSILDSAAADVLAFIPELGDCPPPRFTRLAVTPRQIEQYRLPSAPQKPSDRRGDYMTTTVQAEALSPDELVAEVRAGLEAAVDLDALTRARGLDVLEHAEVQRSARRLPGGPDAG